MTDRLRALREVVTGQDREVEVTPEGEVREVGGEKDGKSDEDEAPRKPTKLAKRVFGREGPERN